MLVAAALAVLGIQAPVQAAGATAAPAAGAGTVAGNGPIPYTSACAAPKKGEFSCFALRRTDVKPVPGLRAATALPSGYGPADLQSAYNLPADGGAGQTIAIVDAYDNPTAEADLAVYRQQYGLTPCTTANGCFSKVDQRGGTNYPAADTGWAGEISLDLDMVSAAAPNAHILLVEGDDSSSEALGASVDEAVALGAKFVSNSYGTGYNTTPGSGEDPSETTALDAYYNHPGVAVVASSGDSAYGVAYPAASQYVTSVGGTALVRDQSSTAGWSESAWSGAGSGCSLYEPKPAFQMDTGCGNRAVADVSAVADPATGVAVYQTYGNSGWAVYGGTSVSSPIIAGVYADAGTPVAGTYPNSYPYAAGTGLHDVTQGSNGSCTPAYLCTGTAGYDGPTGLGTPDGLQAFRTGPHGKLSGTVTDSATGKPIPGATVTAGTDVAHADAQGSYSLTLPVGSYDVTVDAFGYATGTAKGVTIADGAALTRNFPLTQVPSQTVSGKVTDGSGHGWPLYAKITVDGDPSSVWTDPATGAYRVTLPQNQDFTLHVAAVSPGYTAVTKTLHIGAAPQSVDLAMTADPWVATAPGYAVHLTGSTETFDSTTSAPQGWTVTNAAGTTNGWEFDDPGAYGNHTGGDGAFASVDSHQAGTQGHTDTQLVSPVYDFTGKTSPELAFDTMYTLNPYRQTLGVDASDDGGATWTSVWSPSVNAGYYAGPDKVEVPLTDFAGKPAVQLRFRYTSLWSWYWGIDNVFVGQRDYSPTPGGMVVGTVTDANTGKGAVDATVTDRYDPTVHATAVATPEDPNLGDGFYSLFAPGTGKHSFTAVKSDYTALSEKVNVAADSTTSASYKLRTGRLEITPGSLDASVGWGRQATRKLKVKNTGSAPATLKIGEQSGGLQPSSAQGAPLQRIKGDYPLGFVGSQPQAAPTAAKPSAAPSSDAWQSAPNLPQVRMDNVSDSYRGKVYSAFGDAGLSFGGDTSSSDLYALDPVAGTWTKLASAADPRQAPGHGFINGKLYAAGGWGPDGTTDPKLEIYDPVSNTWTTGAPEPKPYAGAGSAVLDGKLYLIGGCASGCGVTDASVYDPASDSWSQIASYPEPVSWSSCAGIEGKVYCAGGTNDTSGENKHAYVYDPAANTWSQLPDMPVALWASAYASANGLLMISSGVSGNALTNQGFAYDPQTGAWSTLPNANTATYRGGGALGFYKVGGATGGVTPSTVVENLPGYSVDPTADIPWLSESTKQLTLRPGASATVTVTLDSGVPQITQPGDYSAQLEFGTNTPYLLPAAPVTLHVSPPKNWGTVTGTLYGATADGGAVPLAGATVQITGQTRSYTLTTDAVGHYTLSLLVPDKPLTFGVSADGYQPVATSVKLKKGATVTRDFTLTHQ
uniref:carboxypeptidase regulatory-like domain-containing protein n=1 Tax=Actinacidiphila oryziradicis TaxID=2571141 RepID=UPI001FE8E418|nr:carboxypeptidase regulatory-like domain-containing protein [Actinacidiphila oryziradicis]